MEGLSHNARAAHWDNVYATKATDQVSWFQAEPVPSSRLIDACNLPRDANIIDIGGGASRLIDALLDRGFANLTVLDIAEAPLESARRRLGADRAKRIQWIVGDVTKWSPAERFDLWHDRAVFHFLVDAADRAAYRDALLRAVKPGGHVIIATFAPDGPTKCSDLPVMRHDAASLAAFLGSSFKLIETSRDDHVTPWGAVQRFQFSRFQRVCD